MWFLSVSEFNHPPVWLNRLVLGLQIFCLSLEIKQILIGVVALC
jgi:hypothetical protein